MRHNSLFFLSLILFSSQLSGCSESTPKPEKNILKAPELPEETVLQNGIATYDEGLFKVSMSSWGELRDGYPTSYYSTLAEIKMADSQFFSGDYPSALVAYEEFAKLHPGHEAMPYVRYQIGNCSFKQYKDVMHDQAPLQTALKSFEQLIEQHPKSEYVVLARRQIDRCRELQAAYERYVADFYARKGLDKAANSRLQTLSQKYPGSKTVEKLREELDEDSSLKLAKNTTTSQAPPSAPKLVSSTQLSESHYNESLRSVAKQKSRVKSSITEESALVTEDADLVPTAPQTQKELLELTCEETSDGAVFIVSTLTPVAQGVKNAQGTLSFAWDRSNGVARLPIESQSEICSADGISLTVSSSATGLSLKLPTDDVQRTNFIILNRPNRVVLSVE